MNDEMIEQWKQTGFLDALIDAWEESGLLDAIVSRVKERRREALGAITPLIETKTKMLPIRSNPAVDIRLPGIVEDKAIWADVENEKRLVGLASGNSEVLYKQTVKIRSNADGQIRVPDPGEFLYVHEWE